MQSVSFELAPLVARLEGMADAKYRDFHSSLVPGMGVRLLGVRVPQLRAIARELLRGDWRGFLEASRCADLYELRLLHAFVLGGAKCPIEEKIALTDAFLPHVENWAVCDGLCSTFKPRAGDREALFPFVLACADSEVEFRKRFGLVMLFSYFAEGPWGDATVAAYRRFAHPGYYARMGAAWGLATLWLSRREAALAILKDGVWDAFTHNKAIQKLRESYRVSDEDKALVQTLRRKAVKSDE